MASVPIPTGLYITRPTQNTILDCLVRGQYIAAVYEADCQSPEIVEAKDVSEALDPMRVMGIMADLMCALEDAHGVAAVKKCTWHFDQWLDDQIIECWTDGAA
jgi:hypothetical protein